MSNERLTPDEADLLAAAVLRAKLAGEPPAVLDRLAALAPDEVREVLGRKRGKSVNPPSVKHFGRGRVDGK